MRKKWKIIIGIVGLILLVGIGLGQCKKTMQKALNASSGVSQTHTVAYGDISTKIEITGEIQPQTVVSIKSRVSGKIVKFYAKENDTVKIGQIIADIEPDYNQANTLFNTKASLKMAELRLDNARKDLSDKSLLLEKQYISQSEYDTASDALKSAEIEYAQASS
ncbi:MAG TPA: biotin/lipoyl-binding protein, partial [Candidatus Cloacimonadota bacterium]|nr:biotin/lipoyl-binding protein [Candidatus Cloacimonadota bacterium]